MSLSPRERGLKFYIPLCFFSMRYDYTTESRFCVFTFYYVSILMGKLTESKNFKFDFTFHYISYFNSSWNFSSNSCTTFTFHYVSILIWQSLRYLSKWGTFTFHYFNYDLHFFFRSAHVIYIPLCLYFNVSAKSHYQAVSSFTFHYVSILMFVPTSAPSSVARLHSIMSLF